MITSMPLKRIRSAAASAIGTFAVASMTCGTIVEDWFSAFPMRLSSCNDATFSRLPGAAAASSRLVGQQPQSFLAPTGPQDVAKTDFTLQIAPVTVELAPNRILSTIGYNGTSPGPRLRMKEGVPVTVNVVNNTDVPEYVHFHGLLIPSDVDGSEEEGTPVVPAARKPQLSVHAHAGRHTLVSHPHHVDGRPASRQLYRNVRLSDHRRSE